MTPTNKDEEFQFEEKKNDENKGQTFEYRKFILIELRDTKVTELLNF